MIPRGAGLATRRVRIAEADVVRLGCALSGYDHFVSVHGDGRDAVVLVTTTSQATLLDEVLAALQHALSFDVEDLEAPALSPTLSPSAPARNGVCD